MFKTPLLADAAFPYRRNVARSDYQNESNAASILSGTRGGVGVFPFASGFEPISFSDAIGRGNHARPYSAFAAIYDKTMGESALPSVIDAFCMSRRRFRVGTASMADIGCGTGLFLRYLTRLGGNLLGVDKSPAMLRIARRRLGHAPVTLLRMDMRGLALPAPVETLTCTFDTINYLLTRADLEATFAGFARALLPGGMLLFDFIPQGARRGRTEARQSVRVGRIRSEWRIRIDPDGRGSVTAIRLHPPTGAGPAPTEIHRQRWHAREEVMRCLDLAGFEMLDCRPAEPGGSGDWLHVVARLKSCGEASRC